MGRGGVGDGGKKSFNSDAIGSLTFLPISPSVTRRCFPRMHSGLLRDREGAALGYHLEGFD